MDAVLSNGLNRSCRQPIASTKLWRVVGGKQIIRQGNTIPQICHIHLTQLRSTIHILINAPLKNIYECWVVCYLSVKITLRNKVARKFCTQNQKYRDAWVGTFKQNVKIALHAQVAHLLERCINQIGYGNTAQLGYSFML